jgi:hypothetical protein
MARAGRHSVVPRWLMNEHYGSYSMPISAGDRPVQHTLLLPFYWMYETVRATYRLRSTTLSPYETSHKFNIPTSFY